MVMSTPKLIRTMSNKELLYQHNKIQREKAHKREYGSYGTGRYVSSSEFWSGHHGTFKDEIERRKRAGLISKNSAKRKASVSNFGFGFPRMRF